MENTTWMILALTGAAVFAIAIAAAMATAAKKARLAYEEALSALSREPHSNERRVAALSAGRAYAAVARSRAGGKGSAVFDEVALQNDLNARLGAGHAMSVAPPAAPQDRIARLAQLGELRASGTLTPEEFESEKRKVLAS